MVLACALERSLSVRRGDDLVSSEAGTQDIEIGGVVIGENAFGPCSWIAWKIVSRIGQHLPLPLPWMKCLLVIQRKPRHVVSTFSTLGRGATALISAPFANPVTGNHEVQAIA